MTAFVPLYVKHFFGDDPHFENAKMVFSVYDEKPEAIDKELVKKLTQEGFGKELLKGMTKPTTDDLYKLGMSLSDAVVKGSPKLGRSMETAIKATEKPVLAYTSEEERLQAHADFYHNVLEEALV
jgi:starch synthase